MLNGPVLLDEYAETMELRTLSPATSIFLLRLQFLALSQKTSSANGLPVTAPRNASLLAVLQPALHKTKRDSSSSESSGSGENRFAFRSYHRHHRFIPFHHEPVQDKSEQLLLAIFKLLSHRPARKPAKPPAKPGKPTIEGPPAENEPASENTPAESEYRPDEDPTLWEFINSFPQGGGGFFDR
ncbi:hypothetical protein BV898_15571 [Hypsibius exemplaris]|uniref:Uncharacterized protein n=1 Tax=Hypsibius exemplaris TaxID=2072580 RepID=A0A9X6NKF5_HYPEX|nr:hypothetical protein BV898_15571 [Hypsibius exemplaris]